MNPYRMKIFLYSKPATQENKTTNNDVITNFFNLNIPVIPILLLQI